MKTGSSMYVGDRPQAGFKTLALEQADGYTIVQLNRQPANAINALMVEELRLCFQELRDKESVQGVILTGTPGFFSAGFDLIELYDYDRRQIRDFWTEFFVLMVELVAFPKPLVAAMTGHAPAGGCVLGFCADYRIMAKGDFVTGMNEIAVGIVVPDSLFKLYSYWIGNRCAYLFLTEGKLFKTEDALLYQLIDETAEPEAVLDRAREKMKAYLTFNPQAWQRSKQHLRQELIQQLRVDFDISNKDTLDQWWDPQARALLAEKVAYLKARRTAPAHGPASRG
jgi:enoyl-CoA hydratase/carnithine racemase